VSEVRRAMTGIRPTGDLTIANYLGAMKPIADMQETYGGDISIFVADLHGLTDQEPDVVNVHRLGTGRSLIAAGVNPERSTIYLQSELKAPTEGVASILDRHTTVAELLRIPTLKEKIRHGMGPESASAALLRYPILMAADIIVQDATDVPVGEDQRPHIEFARDVTDRFNSEYGDTFVKPTMMTAVPEGLRILALNGHGKMSKSVPNSAIFLNDPPSEVDQKIKRAATANPGAMTDVLESHFTLTEALCKTQEDIKILEGLKTAHLDGGKVMHGFKTFMAAMVNSFLEDFQERYYNISDREVVRTLTEGSDRAAERANQVLHRAERAMGHVSLRDYLN
jgi:tryptophanyl-tRNA synthetase